MVDLKATGVTALGEALRLVAYKIETEVCKNNNRTKRRLETISIYYDRWYSDDNWESGLSEFKKAKTAFTVACAAGGGADASILKQITDNVVSLDTADSSSIGKFFQWVTASIGVTSTKVEDSGKEVTGLKELPPPPSELNIVV
jgi:uncharacterized protein YegL